MTVLAMRHVGPYMQIGDVFSQLIDWAEEEGIGHGEAIGLYYDDPQAIPAESLRADAGILVDPDLDTEDPNVHRIDMPEMECAVTVHVGHYSDLGQTWARLFQDLHGSGRTQDDVGYCFEIYKNDPESTPPEHLETHLFVPLQKAER